MYLSSYTLMIYFSFSKVINNLYTGIVSILSGLSMKYSFLLNYKRSTSKASSSFKFFCLYKLTSNTPISLGVLST